MTINAGKYDKKITIVTKNSTEDKDGFPDNTPTVVLRPWARVKTTKGFTIIANNSDFEKALTRFTIRFPQTEITYENIVKYKGKRYTIEYINNIDEANEELELQCKEVLEVGTV